MAAANDKTEKKGPEKKWNTEVERDLLFVGLCAGSMSNEIKLNWSAVEFGMRTLGHDFSKSALNQRFGKVILKSFRSAHGDDIVGKIAASGSAGDPALVTPVKASATKKARSRKRDNTFTPVNNKKDEDGFKPDEGTPTKKSKRDGPGPAVQPEQSFFDDALPEPPAEVDDPDCLLD